MASETQQRDATYFDSPDFVEVRATVFRLLQERKAVTRHSLQYRVAELGAPQDRKDPRTILPALELRGAPLLGRASEPVRPWEPIRGVYVSPRLEDAAIPGAVDSALAAAKAATELLTTARIAQLADTLQGGLSSHSPPSEPGATRFEAVADGLTMQSEERAVDLSGLAGAPVIGAVTNDLDWLYPDDPRLWRHLKRCRDARAYPVFIARKLSIATFPLMKQLSSLAVQLHQIYLPNDVGQQGQELVDLLYWPRTASIENAAQHKGLDILRQLLRGTTRTYVLQLAYDRIDTAVEMGLCDDDQASPRLLMAWVQQAGIEMPEPWHATMLRWIEWDERGLLACPYRER